MHGTIFVSFLLLRYMNRAFLVTGVVNLFTPQYINKNVFFQEHNLHLSFLS